jgi:hypothetical protein
MGFASALAGRPWGLGQLTDAGVARSAVAGNAANASSRSTVSREKSRRRRAYVGLGALGEISRRLGGPTAA